MDTMFFGFWIGCWPSAFLACDFSTPDHTFADTYNTEKWRKETRKIHDKLTPILNDVNRWWTTAELIAYIYPPFVEDIPK